MPPSQPAAFVLAVALGLSTPSLPAALTIPWRQSAEASEAGEARLSAARLQGKSSRPQQHGATGLLRVPPTNGAEPSCVSTATFAAKALAIAGSAVVLAVPPIRATVVSIRERVRRMYSGDWRFHDYPAAYASFMRADEAAARRGGGRERRAALQAAFWDDRRVLLKRRAEEVEAEVEMADWEELAPAPAAPRGAGSESDSPSRKGIGLLPSFVSAWI